MTNEQFRAYIAEKLEWIRRTLKDQDASPEEKVKAQKAKPLYEDAERMARYTSGPAFRRFRRNFERLVGGQ